MISEYHPLNTLGPRIEISVVLERLGVMTNISKRVPIGLMIAGTTLMLLSLMIIVSTGTKAAGVAGTYTSTTPSQGYTDDTYPAKFIYDAKLTLNAGGSGSFWLKYTNVIVHQSGWVNPSDLIGRTNTVSVDYTVLGSSVTVTVHAGTFSFDMRVTLSGNRLSGSGSYTDPSYATNSWTLDVTKSGGGSAAGTPNVGGLAGAAGIGGFLAGFGASILPPPRYMGGSIMRPSKSPLGTPYAPSQSVVLNHQISSMTNQNNLGVTRPLPDVPRMQFGPGPIQFPNVQMGQPTVVQPTDIRQTDVLAKRFCPNCGSTLGYTAAGWGCPFCHRAPPGGLDPR